MKLAEALIQRKDLIKEISRLREEVLNSLIAREDIKVEPIDISKKIKLISEKEAELHKLNINIDKANSKHLLEDINTLKILDSAISFWKSARDKVLHAEESFSSWGKSDVKYEVRMKLEDINDILTQYEKKRREVDRALQRKNWEIDLVDLRGEED